MLPCAAEQAARIAFLRDRIGRGSQTRGAEGALSYQ